MQEIVSKFIAHLNDALQIGNAARFMPRYRNSKEEAEEMEKDMINKASIQWFAAKTIYSKHKDLIDSSIDNLSDQDKYTVKAALEVIDKELTEQMEQLID